MSDAELSSDGGTTWDTIDVSIAHRCVDGDLITGFNFDTDEPIEHWVDTRSELVFRIPEISDDPLVGELRRQGQYYWFVVSR